MLYKYGKDMDKFVSMVDQGLSLGFKRISAEGVLLTVVSTTK